MKIVAVRELVSIDMQGLLAVLVGFGSNGNSQIVWEVVEKVCHSDHEYLPQRIPLAI